jgi:malate dehydrogenase (oxaloacetate-decarboxylating)(NADP+)
MLNILHFLCYSAAVMNISREDILAYHLGGKVGLQLTKQLNTLKSLCIAYTPGVAVPVREIAKDPDAVRKYTAKDNLVAVATDGTAVLGLGDVGPSASIPVMEGKAVLFKAFGDVDGWPVPLNHCRESGANEGPTDPQRVIDAVCAVAPMYGGINLEDIAAPSCFEIEDRLDELLDIPVFHDDQWGTAVITLAGVLNYCLLCERDLSELRVVINGAGAAGIRIADMLKASSVKSVTLCDSKGTVRADRTDLTPMKQKHAVTTSATTVGECMADAHVFIGVSVADCIHPEDVLSMASFPAIFAMANPDPEIRPAAVVDAMGDKPYVMATGRSDYPNQVNNVLGFPFLFRGALDVKATKINTEMKVAAAQALAAVARKPVPDYIRVLFREQTDLEFGIHSIIPKPFDRRLFVEVSYAVAEAAIQSGAAPATDLDAYRQQLETRNQARIQ